MFIIKKRRKEKNWLKFIIYHNKTYNPLVRNKIEKKI